MKGRIVEHWGVIGASLFSVVLIVGAFMFARGVQSPPTAQASEETALLKAIASKDSDNDGLPDWQEALYGTDSHNSDTRGLGMTDGEAVEKGLIIPKAISDVPSATSTGSTLGSLSLDPSLPPPAGSGTLTAAFTQQFFRLYLSARSANGENDLSENQLSDVATQAIALLSSSIKNNPLFKSKSDLIVSGTGSDALIAFAADAENIFVNNKVYATTSEVTYLKQALEDGDQEALVHIASIAKGYREAAVGLAVLPVPVELADADLAAINAFMNLSEIINDFTRIDSDPIVSMLAISRYGQAVQDLAIAIKMTGVVFIRYNVSLPRGAAGERVVTMAENFARTHSANQTKP